MKTFNVKSGRPSVTLFAELVSVALRGAGRTLVFRKQTSSRNMKKGVRLLPNVLLVVLLFPLLR